MDPRSSSSSDLNTVEKGLSQDDPWNYIDENGVFEKKFGNETTTGSTVNCVLVYFSIELRF
jgi:hypothetical protein